MTRGQYTATSGRKVTNQFTNQLAYGAKTIFFAHEATLGDTFIDLTSLTMPVNLLNKGFSNPSTTLLQTLHISYNRDKLKIISSSRGELMKLSFNVPNNMQISFDGFTADAGEVFECSFEPSILTGSTVVDARPLVKTYLLPEGETEILVDPFEYFKFADMQMGAIMVFRGESLTLQLRNVGNATADPAANGNYQELASVNGLSNMIKFNVTAGVGGDHIAIVSVGSLVERPTSSMLAYLETVNGSLERIIDTVADLAGVSKTDFEGLPNSIDLGVFYSRVQAHVSETTYNCVVGSSTQVSNGKATHTTVQGAIGGCPIGGKILVLEGTYTENVIIDKSLQIEGKGRGSIIAGTLAVNGDYGLVKHLKTTENITINGDGNFVRECWIANSKSVTDSGISNSILAIEEA